MVWRIEAIQQSDDEVFELFAVVVGLLAEDGEEDADHDVVDVVGGVLDDGVGQEQLDSDVLEAVGGQHEGVTGPFDGVTNFGGRLDIVAGLDHLLALGHQGEQVSLEFEIVVLNQK